MKCLRTIILLFYSLPFTIQGQQFQQSYGGDGLDIISKIVQLDDQSYLTFGSSSSTGPVFKGSVLHLDGLGNFVEGYQINVLSGSEIIAAEMNENGNIFFGGTSTSMETSSVELLLGEMSLDGEVLWAKTSSGTSSEIINCLTLTSDGGFVAGGSCSSYSLDNDQDELVIKCAADGSVEWAKIYMNAGYDRLSKIVQLEDGSYAFVGQHKNDTSQEEDVHLTKLDADGNLQWTTTYSASARDMAIEMMLMSDGFLIGGDTQSFGEGLNEIFLLKVNFSGNIQWQKSYGGYSHDHLTSIIRGKGSKIVVGGLSGSIGFGGLDALAMELEANGQLNWSKTYGGEKKDVSFDIISTPDGGYTIGGYSRSFAEGFNFNMYLVKTNDRGDCMCNTTWDELLLVNNCDFEVGTATYETAVMIDIQDTPASTEDFVPTRLETMCVHGEITDFEGGSGGWNSGDDVASSMEEYGMEFFNIIPNLSTGELFIELEQNTASNLSIYNISGQLIQNKALPGTGRQTVSLKIDHLSSGIYIISLINKETQITKKISLY